MAGAPAVAGFVIPSERILDEADITVHLDQERGRGCYGVVYNAEYAGQPCVLKVRWAGPYFAPWLCLSTLCREMGSAWC
jgi:hypothetical protein